MKIRNFNYFTNLQLQSIFPATLFWIHPQCLGTFILFCNSRILPSAVQIKTTLSEKLNNFGNNTGHTGFCSANCSIGAPVTPVTCHSMLIFNASHLYHIFSVRLQRLQSKRLRVRLGVNLRHLKEGFNSWIKQCDFFWCEDYMECKINIIQACTPLFEIRNPHWTIMKCFGR